MKSDKLISRIRSAQAVGAPIIAVRTTDQPSVVTRLVDGNGDRAIVIHDVIRGLTAGNELGRQAIAEIVGEGSPIAFGDPVQAIEGAKSLPPKGVMVMLAGDRAIEEPQPALATVIARDTLAAKQCMLIILCSAYQPARELGSDALVLDDAPPDADERRIVARKIGEDANLKLEPADLDLAVRYTRGLSSFAAQQTIALSITRRGLDAAVLRDVWRKAIDGVPGLRVQEDPQGAALERIAGLENLKSHAGRLVTGRAVPDCVVWIDELEKVLAGSTGGDLSGSSQAVLGAILTEMEESKAEGMILQGPPGTGKSLAATTVGAAGGIPTIQLNPGGIKGSLVGQTEANAAWAMATLRAIGGRCYWIATSNNLGTVPPELQRRFTDGIWMVDLPDRIERQAMWAMYLKQYELSGEAPVDDRGYSGADVRNVCRTAWRDGRSVCEVAAGYVPSSRVAKDTIEALRRKAANTYVSASYAGAYRHPGDEPDPSEKTGRKIDLSA